MTNLGVEHAFNSAGIPFARARVGDRYVMEQLLARGWQIGGESSGHIICLDRTTTGDGIVSALQVLSAMRREGRSLVELKAGVHKYPQVLINVRLQRKVDIGAMPEVQSAVREAESELGSRGRVLLRPSGTEPLVRVMVEGEDGVQVERIARQLAQTVSGLVSAA
jgi:phosphoglucosamine mutase